MVDQDTVRCIFCAATISVVGLSDVRYKDHFLRQHNIISFDTTKLVLITFQEQLPTLFQRTISWEREDKETQTNLEAKSQFTQVDESVLSSERCSSLCSRESRSCSPFEEIDQTYSEEFRDRSESTSSHELEKSSSKRERSSSAGSGQLKRSKVEKTCDKCSAVFDQIFDYESHLVSCYNKVRSSTKPSNFNVSSYSAPSYNEDSKIYPDERVPSPSPAASKELVFKCRICGTEVIAWDRSQHLDANHSMTSEEYNNQYGDMVDDDHSCLICHATLEMDRWSVSDHIWAKHRMSIDAYILEFGLDPAKPKQTSITNKSCAQCQICSKTFSRKDNLKRHMRINHSNEEKDLDLNEKCRDLTESKWYNRSGYECRKCKAQFSHKTSLHQHIKNIHKMAVQHYYKEHGELTTTQTFICGICNKKLRWSAETIRDHLDVKHCLSLDNYGEIYIDNIEQAGKNGTVNRTQIEKTSPLRPVAVSVQKLNKNVVNRLFQDTEKTIDRDYSNLSKQDLGKCVNSAIEDLFTFSPVKNSRAIEDYAADIEDIPFKPFRCSTCLYRTDSKEDLKEHTRSLHTKIDTVFCCDSAYTTRWNLFLHLDADDHREEDLVKNQFCLSEILELRKNVKKSGKVRKSTTIKGKNDAVKNLDKNKNKINQFPGPVNQEVSSRDLLKYVDSIDKLSVRFVHHYPLIVDRLVRSQPTRLSTSLTYERVEGKSVDRLDQGDHEDEDVDNPQDIDDLLNDFSDDELDSPPTVSNVDSKPHHQLQVRDDIKGDYDQIGRNVDVNGDHHPHEPRVDFNADEVAYEDNDVDDLVDPHVIWANRCTYSCKVCHSWLNQTSSDEEKEDDDHGESDEGGEHSEDEEERKAEEYKLWVNQCKVNCMHADCDFSTKSVIEFRMHTLSVHSQLFEQYCEIYGFEEDNDIWSKTYHTVCVLCLETIVHSHDSLDAHMVECHDMSGFEYYISHVKDSKSGVVGKGIRATNIEQLVPDELFQTPKV